MVGVDSLSDVDSPWVSMIMHVFLSIALYNVVELIILTTTTFKRFRGLYCWSLFVASWGVAFNAIGFLLRSLKSHPPPFVYFSFVIAGWIPMITGQSLVLYSRLHIVLHSEKLLRAILIMIILDAIWISIPTTILLFLSNSSNSKPYIAPFDIYERIQLTVYFIQEVIISTIYILETWKILKSHRGLVRGNSRRIMTDLLLINVVIIALDITILCFQFGNHYDLQTAWKPLVYSLKLKMEFSILNRLVEMSQQVRRGRGFGLSNNTMTSANTGAPSDGMTSSMGNQSNAGQKSQFSQPEISPPALESGGV